MTTKIFDVEPNLDLLILSKLLASKRNKISLSDRGLYLQDLKPGQHHAKGTISYEVDFTVEDDYEANRSYGLPQDKVLMLAFSYSGIIRKFLVRAAMVVRELNTASLEERPIQDISYFYRDDQGNTEEIKISAKDIMAEGEKLETKLEKDQLFKESIEYCLNGLKVKRKCDGAIKIKSANISLSHKE
jgi:hypothetical protein